MKFDFFKCNKKLFLIQFHIFLFLYILIMFCKNIWLKYKNNIIWKIKFKNLNKNSKLFFFLDWKMRYIYDVLLSRHIGKIRLFYLQVFFLIRESHPMFIDILSIPLLLTFSITQKFIYVRLSIQFIHVYKRIVYIFIIKTNHFWNYNLLKLRVI